MAKVRIGPKAHRVLDFLVGLGDRDAWQALEAQGFTEDELDAGWERLKALSKPRGAPPEPGAPAPDLVGDLEAWERRWFAICEVVLRLNFPAVHAVVFHKLARTEGPEVVASISVLLDRLDAIARDEDDGGLGEEGRRARALLAKRKVTDEVLAEGRALLARVGRVPDAPSAEELDALDREARAAAERRLWSWYLEWSGIARIGIRDRRILRALGFRRAVGTDGDT